MILAKQPFFLGRNMRLDILPVWMPRNIGQSLFGASLAMFAMVSVWNQNFWQPVPDTLPYRTAWLYLASLVAVIGGVGLQFDRTRKPAAILLALLYFTLALAFLPRVMTYPKLIGAWLGFAEHLAIVSGAVAIWMPENKKGRWNLLVRLFYSALAIVFGLSHILSLPETVALVPGWMPGTQAFWAISTGIAHLAVALALIVDRLAVLACRAGALMYFLFAVLVWTPQAISTPQQSFIWSCMALSVALSSALWSLGDLLASDASDKQLS